MIPNWKRCYSGPRLPQLKQVNELPMAAAPAALKHLGRQTHMLVTSLSQTHHGGHSWAHANPTVEIPSPDTHRQAFKSIYFWNLVTFSPSLPHKEEAIFSQKLIKYCKACSKIAEVGKSAAVVIKGYYSLWNCRIFIYGWHPSARSQKTRGPSTQTLAGAGPGSKTAHLCRIQFKFEISFSQ